MSERAKFRVGEKKRVNDLRGEVKRLTAKVEDKRTLANELPVQHRKRLSLIREIQQLDRRITSYGVEIGQIAETLKTVKAEAEEKIARPRNEIAG